MFDFALWKSRTHAKQPLWFILGPMLAFLIAIPFIIEFLGLGVVFAIDLILVLALLFAVIITGRKFKWHNTKLLFAIMPDGIYFTTVNANNGSYFCESFNNIKGYSFAPDGNYYTVKVYFKQKSNAGIFGNINFIKMIKIENFDKLQEVLASFSIPVIEENKK